MLEIKNLHANINGKEILKGLNLTVRAENEISKRVYFMNADTLKPVGQSEEHLVIEVQENHSYKIGDIFYGLPYHV